MQRQTAPGSGSTIPAGAVVRRLKNGDRLITYPGAALPALCVPARGDVRTAITRAAVRPDIAESARRFVERAEQNR